MHYPSLSFSLVLGSEWFVVLLFCSFLMCTTLIPGLSLCCPGLPPGTQRFSTLFNELLLESIQTTYSVAASCRLKIRANKRTLAITKCYLTVYFVCQNSCVFYHVAYFLSQIQVKKKKIHAKQKQIKERCVISNE